MAMESKMAIYDLIPAHHIPKTLHFEKHVSVVQIITSLKKAGIDFPFIVKPDIGMKAFAVEKIKSAEGLSSYMRRTSGVFIAQELIEYPSELGIFYVRNPNEERGRITGIVAKEFLAVNGDGRHSILELIKQNPRSHFQLAALKRTYGSVLDTILPMDEKFILVPYGSHTRGAKFSDVTKKSTEALVTVIDRICRQIPGFYYGRLDILCTSMEDLEHGKNFKIIEINGAGSEATHIYDPGHSLFYAWREIIRHWILLYRVSLANYEKGHSYLSYKDGREMLRANNALEAQLKLL